MANNNVNQLTDLIFQVARRSMTDEDFRKKAMEDPKGALEEVNGGPVKNGADISFVESTETSSFKVALPPSIGGEFSDADLEAVAGGGKSIHDTCTDDSGSNCTTNSGSNIGGSNTGVNTGVNASSE